MIKFKLTYKLYNMKHLNNYIIENFNDNEILQINEVITAAAIGAFTVYALCAACVSHFSIKGLKKVGETGRKFWNWAIGESLENNANIIEESIIEEKKFDKSKVQPMQVPDEEILNRLMEKFKTDAKKKNGFYVFDQLFKDTPELKNINKKPYYPNYVVFMDAGSEENEDVKPNIYGMLGFSLKYWNTVAKKGKDEKIKEEASKLTKYINIFGVQTDKKYAKKGLFEVYLEDMKKAVKEVKYEGLTIKYENDDIAEIFAKYGFEKIDELKGYMILTTNKHDTEEQ